MKNLVIITSVLTSVLLTGCGNGSGGTGAGAKQGSADTGTAEIIFREYEHSFGKVTEGEKIGYVFTFENTGSGALVIANATTSCGCTVPKYDTRPIAPGANGNVEVVFNTSGYNGIQTKTVKIKSNASIPVILLKITAEVVPDKSNH